MNKAQRKELQKAEDLLSSALEIIQSVQAEEEDKFDGMTEGLQQTQRGMDIEECASELEGAASDLESVIDQLGDVINK